MEKYRKFADAATGNHPFLPTDTRKAPFLKKAKYYCIGPILLLLRLPLLAIVYI